MDRHFCNRDEIKKAALRRPDKTGVPHPALISGTRSGLALEGA